MTVNNWSQLDNWMQSKLYRTGQLNTVNNCTQLNTVKTVHNLTTEYSQQLYNWTTDDSQQPYTTGQLNTVNNCTQLGNWIQSWTVHNCTTDYSQELYTTGQLNTVNNCTQLDNWIQSTTGQLIEVNNCTQLDNWIQSTVVPNLTVKCSEQPYTSGQLNTVNTATEQLNIVHN